MYSSGFLPGVLSLWLYTKCFVEYLSLESCTLYINKDDPGLSKYDAFENTTLGLSPVSDDASKGVKECSYNVLKKDPPGFEDSSSFLNDITGI